MSGAELDRTVGDGHARAQGFETNEYARRWSALQHGMRDARLDALLVTSPPNLAYVTGRRPPLLASPARSWFALLPADRPPAMVAPSLGIEDLHDGPPLGRMEAFDAPRDDEAGLRALEGLIGCLPRRFARLGIEAGAGMRLGLSLAGLEALRSRLPEVAFADAAPVLWAARLAKSDAEAGMMQRAAAAAGAGFAAVARLDPTRTSERGAAAALVSAALAAGAEAVPYLAAASGPGGYDGLVRRPGSRELQPGDVLGLDVGARVEGYWCDFNRNFSAGPVSPEAARAFAAAHAGLEAASAIARPGVAVADLWAAMARVIEARGYAPDPRGRMGHGVGLDFTEPPSLAPWDGALLTEGLVLAIEPSFAFVPALGAAPALMVHEELIRVEAGGCRILTPRSEAEILSLGRSGLEAIRGHSQSVPGAAPAHPGDNLAH